MFLIIFFIYIYFILGVLVKYKRMDIVEYTKKFLKIKWAESWKGHVL